MNRVPRDRSMRRGFEILYGVQSGSGVRNRMPTSQKLFFVGLLLCAVTAFRVPLVLDIFSTVAAGVLCGYGFFLRSRGR